MSVQIIDNFISDSDAKAIIDDLSPYLVPSERDAMAETRFKDYMGVLRSIYDGRPILEEESSGLGMALFSETINRVGEEINKFYNVEVVPINPMMAQITEGGKNDGLHCDSVQLDGSPWEDGNTMLDDLEFSALVYLNSSGSDYSGGQIHFPNQNLEVLPKTGQMIFFRGDIDHPHGVSEVTSGERYALVLFYGRSDRVKAYLQYKTGQEMG
jgi:2OG-Fe(II) oxygenase superfamily